MSETSDRPDGADAVERLFIALDLPEEIRRALGRVRSGMGEFADELRWVRGVGLHVTLKFLGDVDADDKARLISALAALPESAPFELRCVGLGVFGPSRKARVFWAGIEGNVVALNSLQSDVEEAAASAGCELETRPFRPHVTLARVRGSGGGVKLAPALGALLTDSRRRMFGEWTVGQVVLYRSRLTREGAVYTPAYTHKLGTAR